jgi:hypothetical protein
MRYAIVSLEGTAPAWVAEALPPGWRVVPGTLHDLAVLIEGPAEGPIPTNAHAIDAATAELIMRARRPPN